MLIERFFSRETGRESCGDIGARLLSSTAHLIRARSVAVAATGCVFQARLGETMGVRGFYHSVLPGKGVILHLLLALSFPRAFREFAKRGFEAGAWVDSIVDESIDRLLELGFEEDVNSESREKLRGEASQMLASGLDFVSRAFRAIHREGWREALSRSVVLVENHMLSYTLHVWGVPDVIVEDPVTRTAAVIEWKTYTPDESKSAEVKDPDEAQAYVYALLEAERLYGDPTKGPLTFDELRRVVLGDPPSGSGASVIPGFVRLARTSRASPVRVRHPLLCIGFRGKDKCGYDVLSDLLAKIVLAAEHLTLSLTNVSKHLRTMGLPEAPCSVSGRIVFRRIPWIELDGRRVNLMWGNPRKDPPSRLCNRCIPGVREVCEYYVSKGGNIVDPSLRLLNRAVMEALERAVDNIWREAWRARFAIYGLRENALKPYKTYRKAAITSGVDGDWIKGHLEDRVLRDGFRVDFFDEARVEDGEVVLKRKPMRWEEEKGYLVTLREGKPAAVFFRERHVRDPLLRLSFHGTVSRVYFDYVDGLVTVRLSPANRPSKIYPEVLSDILSDRPEIASGVVAMEVNVELTQLELMGVTAMEIGTVARLGEAARRLAEGEEVGPQDILALYFGGVPRYLRRRGD